MNSVHPESLSGLRDRAACGVIKVMDTLGRLGYQPISDRDHIASLRQGLRAASRTLGGYDKNSFNMTNIPVADNYSHPYAGLSSIEIASGGGNQYVWTTTRHVVGQRVVLKVYKPDYSSGYVESGGQTWGITVASFKSLVMYINVQIMNHDLTRFRIYEFLSVERNYTRADAAKKYHLLLNDLENFLSLVNASAAATHN